MIVVRIYLSLSTFKFTIALVYCYSTQYKRSCNMLFNLLTLIKIMYTKISTINYKVIISYQF